ncbi:MAG: 2'-5' RNA ligase family protein [Actinomycetota bacterium]
MNASKRLFFIALLPPQEIQASITEIKQHFAEHYASRHALKSPPHITLQPPFEWLPEELPRLEEWLANFTTPRSPFSITLSGFAAFPPRVIYVNVIKTPELLAIHQALMAGLEANLGIIDPASKTRPFSPHMTVAFRDLTRKNFQAAWPKFEQRSLDFEFTASQLTLLIHDNSRWNIKAEFLLGN